MKVPFFRPLLCTLLAFTAYVTVATEKEGNGYAGAYVTPDPNDCAAVSRVAAQQNPDLVIYECQKVEFKKAVNPHPNPFLPSSGEGAGTESR
jgi:hypothetical protein